MNNREFDEIARLTVFRRLWCPAHMSIDSLDSAINALQGTDWDLRIDAERYLANHDTLDSLAPLASAKDWKVRLYSIRVLAQLEGPSNLIAEFLNSRMLVETDDWILRNLEWGVAKHTGHSDGTSSTAHRE